MDFVEMKPENIKNNKKSFFYNPYFRMSVYIMAWASLSVFKLFTLFNPNLNRVIASYESGQFIAAAKIGFTSGLVLGFGFFLFCWKSIAWTKEAILLLPIIHILIGFLGWLSLIKYRDYEREKNNGL
ncbi:MAG: hypothetical protein GY874_18205 [Desulfobacteraceae bacterium]|nr:hypothetical protein [Desulfobacteraceae bacterium]